MTSPKQMFDATVAGVWGWWQDHPDQTLADLQRNLLKVKKVNVWFVGKEYPEVLMCGAKFLNPAGASQSYGLFVTSDHMEYLKELKEEGITVTENMERLQKTGMPVSENMEQYKEDMRRKFGTKVKENYRCEWCTAPLTQLKRCDRCQLAYYCSRECQVKDWKKGGHKGCCKPPSKPQSTAPEGAVYLRDGTLVHEAVAATTYMNLQQLMKQDLPAFQQLAMKTRDPHHPWRPGMEAACRRWLQLEQDNVQCVIKNSIVGDPNLPGLQDPRRV